MKNIKLDFSEYKNIQDILRIIKDKTGLSIEESIKLSVNIENYNTIKELGYARIALSMWGHADQEREWRVLENTQVELNIDDSKYRLLSNIKKGKSFSFELIIGYFLIFQVEKYGFHI